MNQKNVVTALKAVLAEKQEHLNAIKAIDIVLTALRGFLWSSKVDDAPKPKKKAAAHTAKRRYVERGLVPAALENVLSAGAMAFGDAVNETRKHLLTENHSRVPVRKIKACIWRYLASGRITIDRDSDTLTLIKA